MTNRTGKRGILHRAVTLVLTFSLLTGLLPVQLLTPEASAAHWAQPALDKLVDLGILRGGTGGLRPDADITRAEFVAMINRAYGYKKGGSTPFNDVPAGSWYAEDIAIAYNTGYFKGTSTNTASPNSSLTREEAVVMLGRNMMMKETVGEPTTYTDGREFSTWSRGYIETATRYGVVQGSGDGTFRAKNKITRAEVATMLSNALGTVLGGGGEYTLGGVYGNVTINSSGTKLKDTVIAGDLYVTGGLEQGYATLENVTVLGRIVVSGGGEGHEGDNSVLLRNVDADTVVVDRFDDQFITLRAEGVTTVGDVDVRTSAYLEDVTPSGYGFLNIGFDADRGSTLDLSGNIEKVKNFTPDSTLKLAKGSALDITVDEAAVGSEFIVDSGAVSYSLNLDAATNVDGLGSITQLNVAAPGSEAAILPDYIYIRPGITADINGTEMDSKTADESSEDPRLLSGYGAARNIAPTSFDAAFAANKSGTVYWAITSIADGSLDSDMLINPPSYATSIIKSGSVQTTAAGKEATAKVTGLTKGGTYYLSAVFVDARGMESPVKVTRFTTPDDTVPAFASGYPYLSQITNVSAQATVMTNKSCQLYWAVLPKGSTAPTAQDFKSAAISGNLGYGTTEVEKNETVAFQVNNQNLKELVSYDLYLWLTDVDGAKSSAVKKITFTTVDKTPPVFNVEMTVNKLQATSIGAIFNLNEAGTVYWVAVPSGTEYPKPLNGVKPLLDSDAAKLAVTSGINGFKSGKATATANKDGTVTISGLEKESAYDIYYVAQDKAGNYSKTVKMITANTLDASAPTVTQEFTDYYESNMSMPLADTDVRIVFNEGVQHAESGKVLLELYNAVLTADGDAAKAAAKLALREVLSQTILLFPSPNPEEKTVPERENDQHAGDWVIDYRNAIVENRDGETVVTFPTTDDANYDSALNLASGASYHFRVKDIADISTAQNRMPITNLPTFTTVFAQISISTTNEIETEAGDLLDMSFRLVPISTSKVNDMNYDMLLWADTSLKYKLFYRVLNRDDQPLVLEGYQPVDRDEDKQWDLLEGGDGWQLLDERELLLSGFNEREGLSLSRHFLPLQSERPVFSQLNLLQEDCFYEYAIQVTEIGGNTERETWSRRVNMQVSIVAGLSQALENLSGSVTPDGWGDYVGNGVTAIGTPEDFTMRKQFSDSVAPEFADGRPLFDVGDTHVTIDLLLNRAGTLYYVVVPRGNIPTRYDYGDGNGEVDIMKDDAKYLTIPTQGETYLVEGDTNPMLLAAPKHQQIVGGEYNNTRDVQYGTMQLGAGAVDLKIEDLDPQKDYAVYFVIKGTGTVYSDVYCYRFTTEKPIRPIITLNTPTTDEATVKTNRDSEARYILMVYNHSGDDTYNKLLREKFIDHVDKELLTEYNAKYGSAVSKIDGTAGLTVLDALLENHVIVEDGKNVVLGSIFDCFAMEDTKTEVSELVSTDASVGSVVKRAGAVDLTADRQEHLYFKDYMSDTTQHLLLVVAKSTLDSGEAFRGIMPLMRDDADAPLVTDCEFVEDPSSNPVWGNLVTSGELTIGFNEGIYLMEGLGYKPIENIVRNTGANPTEGFAAINYAFSRLPSTATIVSDTNGTGKIAQTVTFKITNAGEGETIRFTTDLCDWRGNTRGGTALTLTLRFEATPNPLYPDDPTQAIFKPYFEVTSAWSGISSAN